jgi:hypothetical protein
VTIDTETLMQWRADAVARGGRPRQSDPDPHVRFLANRLVQVIDMLTGAAPQGEAGEGEAEEYHDGVIYGIRHPGPKDGCTYCETTIQQAETLSRWTG